MSELTEGVGRSLVIGQSGLLGFGEVQPGAPKVPLTA
jgi:hypothetical protein